MTRDPGCNFCEIAATEEPAREVLRTDSIVAFFPTNPATLGHTLVVPRDHIRDIWSLDQATSHELTDATLKVAHGVKNALNMDGLNIIQSNGEAATQSVFHLHVHVVPRRSNDDIGRIWPPATSWSEAAKDSAWERIREAVSELQ
ncbi:MAG: HIT family protein [Aeromicrobium sp.]